LNNRAIKFAFREEKTPIFADLLEEDAPNTSNAIWNALPVRSKMLHDIWSGHLVFVHIDTAIKLPAENLLTYLPTVGDVYYYYRPPHYFRGAPYGETEAAEIGLVYDRDSRPQGARGPKAVNIFAHVRESDVKRLKKVCELMLFEGAKDVEITRG